MFARYAGRLLLIGWAVILLLRGLLVYLVATGSRGTFDLVVNVVTFALTPVWIAGMAVWLLRRNRTKGIDPPAD
jgi:hypothetical protein